MWQENPNYVQPNPTSGSYQGLEHSILVQKTIGDPLSCHSEFAQYGDEYSGNEIPIVLVPNGKFCNLLCCIPGLSFAVAVPSGPYVLWQKWHRDMGELSPGVQWIWPFWKRMSHIVTSAAITYNAPARNCPTADAVPVNVDLTLTFQIGPDAEAARKFVYRLGAHRFDEMLTAETEEAIRGLVYSVTHDQVNDLREEFAVGMKSVLNNKIEKYGVQILFVKITDVVLPYQLQQRLQDTTAFKTKMGETEKVHENRVRVLKDQAFLELEAIRKKNARQVQEISAERQRYEIERRELELIALGEAKVQEVAEVTKAEVRLKKAQGNEQVEKVRAKLDAEHLIRKTDIKCQDMKIKAEEKAKVMIKDSEAELEVAESSALSMVAIAEAELEGQAALAEKRSYQLEWKRLEILKEIASKGRKFVTDEQGETLLNSLVPASEVPNGRRKG